MDCYIIESDRISLANKLQSISQLIPNGVIGKFKIFSHANKIDLILLVDSDDDVFIWIS